MNSKIYRNVIIDKNAKVGDGCILGLLPKDKKKEHAKLVIGTHSNIRPFTVIYTGSVIGNFFETGTHVSIREDNHIGNHVVVGTGSVLEIGNKIGNNVRIHSGCFMELAELEDNVFVGPCVVMTDDLHPPCPRFKDCVGGVKIRKNAKIGANSTILPGITIGLNALIGAGSVVTKNVPNNVVVAGNPAKIVKNLKELKCIKEFFDKPYDWEQPGV